VSAGTPARVSVVTRCHNHGRFLEEAMASVLTQSRPVEQIVVVDDGSTDSTGAVLDRLAATDPRVTVVTHDRARGAAAAFNAGVLASDGDVVLPLDADDRLSSRYVELTVEHLTRTGADLAYGGERRFGTETAERPAPPWDADELMVENFLHVSTLFRRWVFDATGGFDERFERTGLEDWAFWIAAVEAGARGVPVEGCWLEYRRSQDGSRNRLSHAQAGAAHYRAWRYHRRVVRPRHLARWATRSATRNLRRLARPSAR
jgi:hypothetical protein